MKKLKISYGLVISLFLGGFTPSALAIAESEQKSVKNIPFGYNAQAFSLQESFHEAIKSNDEKSVAEHIDMVDINTTDEEGLAPLHYVAMAGNLSLMQMLVDHGADINIKSHALGKDGYTPLHYAAAIGDIKGVQCLIDLGAKVKPMSSDYTPFREAYRQGHIGVCELLKKYGAYDLLEASFCANLEDIRDFLKNGDANYSDPFGHTALHWAAMNGNNEVIKILINYGANINALNNAGTPPIFFAITRNLVSTIQLMIRHGATLSYTSKGGFNFLHRAAFYGYLETAKLLIENGISPNSVTDEGETPLDLAKIMNADIGSENHHPSGARNYSKLIDFLRSCK